MVITEEEQTAAFVRNFNPLLEVGDVRWPTKRAMYEPLLVYNIVTGEYVPWLGEHWHWNDDATELEFVLREGVKWSDGQRFGAEDVAFTFNLMRKSAALDPRGIWGYLAAVEAPDAQHVKFRFQRAYVPGLIDIGQQPIVPAHLWKDVEDPVSFANENPVATGPFTEVRSFNTQVYEIGRNPHYWQAGKPAVKALRFPAFPSNDQTVLSLMTGEIDWAGAFVPAIDRIYIERNPKNHHYWFPTVDGTVMLFANTALAPFDDMRVRKALSMAIDRALVVRVAMHGYTKPADATGLSGAYDRFRDPEAVAAGKPWVSYDPEAAAALLEEAGLRIDEDGRRLGRDGEPLEVAINVPAGFSDWVRATQVISKNLQALGIDARIKAYDFSAWYNKIQNGDFSLSLGWTVVSPTPYGFYRDMMSTSTWKPLGDPALSNWHRFKLERADILLATAEHVTDPEQQRRLYGELQRLFVEHAPAIPLFPGALWGEYNDERFVGFPDADNPYAPLGPNLVPGALLVVTELRPR